MMVELILIEKISANRENMKIFQAIQVIYCLYNLKVVRSGDLRYLFLTKALFNTRI